MHKILIILSTFFISCSQQQEIGNSLTVITFDKTKESHWNVDSLECKFIPLETTGDCLLGSIVNIQFYNNHIFITDGDQNGRVFEFDNQGKYITQIGHLGDGPGGYLMPLKIHIDEKNNLLSIADIRLNRLTHYRLNDYQYVSQQSLFNFYDCIWLEDGNILWYDLVGFDAGRRKIYPIYITNTDLEDISYLGNIPKNSPYCMGVHTLYQYDHKTYVSFPYRPTVYSVTSTDIKPVYTISFGKQEMPPEEYISNVIQKRGAVGPDMLLKSDYVNSFIMHENNNYLAISYFVRIQNSTIGFYNKKTKETNTFHMKDFSKKIGIIGGFYIIGTYDDYFVMCLSAKDLKSKPTFREDLNQIADKISEEDNPVLCLFKPK
ncbi:6-bladed beta-propeller [Parabacteroides chinchillae]